MEPSYQDAKDLQPVIQRWRRELHQIPEIGLKLPKTEAYVKEKLCKMGLTVPIWMRTPWARPLT